MVPVSALLLAAVVVATPSPGPSTVPAITSLAFSSGLATNTHFDRTDGQWQNYTLANSLLHSLGFKWVRSPLCVLPGANNRILNELMTLDDGDKPDAIRSIELECSGMTAGAIIKQMAGLWGVSYFELPNELDVSDKNYVADDVAAAQQTALVKNWPNISVIAPSLTTADPATINAVAPYANYGNEHPYTGNRSPFTTGWGGDVYGNGTVYATEAWNVATAQRAVPGKPVIATEYGWNTKSGVSETTQAAYLEQKELQCALLGRLCVQYDLLDDNTESYGIADVNGRLKPAAFGLQGLNALLSDPPGTPAGSCMPNATVTSSVPIAALLVCHASGEEDLVYWQPIELQNPDTLAVEPVTPVTVSVVFGQTGTSRLYQQTTQYHWFENDSPIISNLIATERPAILALKPGTAPTFGLLQGIQ